MRIAIFDGMNLFLRNFAVVPEMDSNGRPIGGMTSSIRSLKAYIRDNEPDRVFVCWDGPGGSSARRGMFSEYKSGRKPRLNRDDCIDETAKSSAENLGEQLHLLKDALKHLPITQIELAGTEADDLVAYLCLCLESLQSDSGDTEITIVSTDNDFLQLVSKNIRVYSPTKKETYTTEEINSKYGVHHSNFIFLKALAIGDKSDNLPKIKGLGMKKFIDLFPFVSQRETSLHEIISFSKDQVVSGNKKYQSIVDQAELAQKCIDLAQLKVPIINSESSRVVRDKIQERQHYNGSDFRLMLLREGISVKDADLLNTFSSLNVRTNNTFTEELA